MKNGCIKYLFPKLIFFFFYRSFTDAFISCMHSTHLHIDANKWILIFQIKLRRICKKQSTRRPSRMFYISGLACTLIPVEKAFQLIRVAHTSKLCIIVADGLRGVLSSLSYSQNAKCTVFVTLSKRSCRILFRDDKKKTSSRSQSL